MSQYDITLEDYIAAVEDVADMQLLSWQKEILQRVYENKFEENTLYNLIPDLDKPADHNMYILIRAMVSLPYYKGE